MHICMLTEVEKALKIGENMVSWCYHLVFTICLVSCEELEIQEDRVLILKKLRIPCIKEGITRQVRGTVLGKRIEHYGKGVSILGVVSFVYLRHCLGWRGGGIGEWWAVGLGRQREKFHSKNTWDCFLSMASVCCLAEEYFS